MISPVCVCLTSSSIMSILLLFAACVKALSVFSGCCFAPPLCAMSFIVLRIFVNGFSLCGFCVLK